VVSVAVTVGQLGSLNNDRVGLGPFGVTLGFACGSPMEFGSPILLLKAQQQREPLPAFLKQSFRTQMPVRDRRGASSRS